MVLTQSASYSLNLSGGLSFVLLSHALIRSNTHVLYIPLMCCYELVFKIISIPFLIISVILIRLFQFNSIVFPVPLTQRSILSSSIFQTSSILSSSIFLTPRFVLKLTSVRFFFFFFYTSVRFFITRDSHAS